MRDSSSELIADFELQRSELGKYAHEDKMPEWLISLLKKGKYVKSEGEVVLLVDSIPQYTR